MEPSILPIGWGSLRARDVVFLALPTYLASAASITDHTSILIPARLRLFTISGIGAASANWTSHVVNPIEVSTAQ